MAINEDKGDCMQQMLSQNVLQQIEKRNRESNLNSSHVTPEHLLAN